MPKQSKIYYKTFGFNVWDVDSAKAVVDATSNQNSRIFLQMSAKVFDKIDQEEFINNIKRHVNKNGGSVIIHLDHSRDIDQIKRAIELGWDSVMYDGSHLPLSENINKTNTVVEIAQKKNVLVEAEIGQIKGVEDGIIVEREKQILLEDVQKFVSCTNVDLLAVAIGTAHGQYGDREPNINYALLKQIEKTIETPFVVHGGSELSNETLKKLWSYKNVKKINISTDIKQAYRAGIVNSKRLGLLEENGFDALKVESQIYESIKAVAISKLKVLGEI